MRPAASAVRDLSLPIRVITVLIVVLLVAIALMITGRTEQILIERFNEYHRTMVRLAAHEIEHAFSDAVRMLELLGDPPLAAGGDEGAEREQLRRIVRALEEEGAADLVRVDPAGRPARSAFREVSTLAGVVRIALRECPSRPAGAGPCAVPLVEPHDERLPARLMLLTVPRLAGPAPGPSGALVLLLDWDRLAARLRAVTTVNRHSAGWMLGEDGTLLWSVAHPSMVRRSAVRPDGSCGACHASFELERRMIAGEGGVGEVEVRGAKRKLVAWAELEVAGHRWFLAGSAPYDDVVASGRRNRAAVFVAKGFLVVVIVVLAVLLDVQNRRRIRLLRESEQSVKLANERLEEEVRKRTEELHALYAEMHEIRARFTVLERLAIVGELASIVAHEIRTPLNSLAIALQRVARLLRPEPEPDVGKAKELVEAQAYEIRRIDAFIEEYLRLVRLPKPSRKPQDVNAIVADVLRFMEVEEQRHQVRFLRDLQAGLPSAEVDGDQIRQVLLNLLVNALQAMPGGGTVTVRTQLEGDDVVISVTDDGPGIPAENLPKLFEPFFTTKDQGTGLGLAICSRLIREHGGTIVCESEPGKGASFRIRLPLRPPAQPAGTAP